jgi:hypothetical protein
LERYAAFRAAFAEALDPRLYDLDHLDRMLLERRAAVFFSDNGAIVAGVRTYPTGAQVLEIVVAAGPRAELVDTLYPQVEAWGRERGCTLALIESRPGWARAMKRHGYETHQVSIIKEL